MENLIASPTQMAYALRDLQQQVDELKKELQTLKVTNGTRNKKNK